MLRRYRAVSPRHSMNVAVLEEGESIAEDEVDGALYVAISVVMSALVVVERVLSPQEPAVVESSSVAGDSECDGLLPPRAGRRNRGGVHECYVLGYEVVGVDDECCGVVGSDRPSIVVFCFRHVSPTNHGRVRSGAFDGHESSQRRDAHLLPAPSETRFRRRRKFIKKNNKNNVRVNTGVDSNDDSDDIDERNRVNCRLNRGEITHRRLLVNSDGIRREELVDGVSKHGMPETTNEPNPFHELLFNQTLFRRIHSIPISQIVSPRPYTLRVAHSSVETRHHCQA